MNTNERARIFCVNLVFRFLSHSSAIYSLLPYSDCRAMSPVIGNWWHCVCVCVFLNLCVVWCCGWVCVCVCACVRACVRACVPACKWVIWENLCQRQQAFRTHNQKANWKPQRQQWFVHSIDHRHTRTYKLKWYSGQKLYTTKPSNVGTCMHTRALRITVDRKAVLSEIERQRGRERERERERLRI